MADRKLTILFVAEVSHIGGATTAIEELANAMVKLGHTVVLVQGLDRDGINWSKKNLDSRVKVHNFQVNFRTNVRVFSSIGWGVWQTLTLVGQRYRFDVIYTNYAYSAGLTCVHPLYRSIKKIFLFHGDEVGIMWSMIPKPKKHKYLGLGKRLLFSGPYIAIVWLMQQVGLKYSQRVVSFSHYTSTYLQQQLGVAQSRISQFSLGVDPKIFKPALHGKASAKEKIGLAASQQMIVCTSRFEYRKGIDFLVSAFDELVTRNQHVHLYLATSADDYYLQSSYFISILKKIKDHGLSTKVHILLNLDRNQLVQYYQAADICAFPSRALETFGLISLESMACGTPVVCSQFAGAPSEIIEQVSKKLLFTAFTERNLANTMERVLAAKADLNKYSQAGITIARSFSWKRTAQQLASLYD